MIVTVIIVIPARRERKSSDRGERHKGTPPSQMPARTFTTGVQIEF